MALHVLCVFVCFVFVVVRVRARLSLARFRLNNILLLFVYFNDAGARSRSLRIVYSAETKAVAAAAAPIALLRAEISAAICASEGRAPLKYTHTLFLSALHPLRPSFLKARRIIMLRLSSGWCSTLTHTNLSSRGRFEIANWAGAFSSRSKISLVMWNKATQALIFRLISHA